MTEAFQPASDRSADPRPDGLGSLFFIALGQALSVLPHWLLRAFLWLLTHTVYRLRVTGGDNVPASGGALLVCNHLSFLDGMLLTAATRRQVRFVMYKGIYDHPVVNPWARMTRAISISSELRPRDMIQALRKARQAVLDGDLVCIFAEGQITRIGHMLPFRRGFERVAKGVDAPIIPVHLDGAWGSIFSFDQGRFLWKIPWQIPYDVGVSFGRPMPPASRSYEVRQAVQELATEAYQHRKQKMRTLPRSLVRGARRHPFRLLMADASTPRVTFISALIKSIYLARRLQRVWEGQRFVGILLPPTVGGALVNFAASLTGKIPVNLNYTTSESTITRCMEQAGVRTVVTARAFLEKVPLKLPGMVLLEEVAAKPRLHEKLMAALMAWTFPVQAIEKALGGLTFSPNLDDLATVIFSSGSTGEPKGVMLTHFNIVSNIDQMGQVFMLNKHDRVMSILPLFHAFGYTVLLWLPPVLGIGSIYHPNPLDARAVGELTEKYRCTLLVATPTFLQTYMRRCTREEFSSLQYMIVGAEKLPTRVADAFEEQYGLAPLEGYGCTECAPVVAVNCREYREPGFRQVGTKRGKIGHPLPGISVKIVDPETMEPLPLGESGLLLVKGPNVMLGYFGRPDKTAEVIRDGWYITGDIAALDEDGFLTMSDRLSRFSKMGGEMVPHLKIEDILHGLAGVTEQTFAVTAVHDERKGERLAVLHTLGDEELKVVLDRLADEDLPALWKPRPNQFYRVEALPYLGTGKIDLGRVRQIARERAEVVLAASS
ncbi:MAG TPA: AMP-binding protein [Terriglobales bacterium]|nr:AMP-binding protein [Terriglobales bacterium]